MASMPEPESSEGATRDEVAPAEEGDISWGQLLRSVYLTIDRGRWASPASSSAPISSSISFRRTPSWLDMFSNDGILPAHVSLFRPQGDNLTLFHAFTTAGELWVLWAMGS
jgi:hypothetical protein